MREIIYHVATSLDGFIAGLDDDITWLAQDGDYGLSAFMKSVDTIIMGRRTQEVGERFGHPFFEGKHNIVFSRSHTRSNYPEIEYYSGSTSSLYHRLQSTPGKDIWLVGGAKVAAEFFDHNLIDKLVVAVHPVLVGSGIPLRTPANSQVSLELQTCTPYPDGLVMMEYSVVDGPAQKRSQ